MDDPGVDTQFTIDRETGRITIGSVHLEPLQPKAEVEPQIIALVKGSRDHENGYEWLYLAGLTFGDQPAFLGLCFHNGRLEQASWSVQLPDASTESDWPTREAIDAEVAFVRDILAQDGFDVSDAPTELDWGTAWSTFDAKGFLASNGLRYRPPNVL